MTNLLKVSLLSNGNEVPEEEYMTALTGMSTATPASLLALRAFAAQGTEGHLTQEIGDELLEAKVLTWYRSVDQCGAITALVQQMACEVIKDDGNIVAPTVVSSSFLPMHPNEL